MDAQAIAKEAEAAYNALDRERIAAPVHPDVVWYWNGKRVCEGLKNVLEQHGNGGIFSRKDFRIRKTLRASSANIIGVELVAGWVDAGGNQLQELGRESRDMHDVLLRNTFRKARGASDLDEPARGLRLPLRHRAWGAEGYA